MEAWNFSGLGIEPYLPALIGGFFAVEPPVKPGAVYILSILMEINIIYLFKYIKYFNILGQLI